MKRYCLVLGLKDEPELIAAYEAHHQKVWPEIIQSIKDAGIDNMEIYRAGNRLFMIMETNETFSFEKKAQMDAANQKVQEWEALMSQYQQKIPIAKANEKWVVMNQIFSLTDYR